MRRMGKQRLAAILLAAAVMSTNTCMVFATESTETKTEQSESQSTSQESSKTESTKTESSKSESSEKTESSSEKSESSEKTESSSEKAETKDSATEKQEATESKDEAGSAETEEKSETVGNVENGQDNQEAEASKDGEKDNVVENGGEEGQETTTEEGTENAVAGAEPGTEAETEEKSFTNKDGESVLPSSLIGTTYTSVAATYDGEENVIKRYEHSDTYGADAIMDSYIDEDGNLIMVISQGAEVVEAAPLEATKGSSKDAPKIDGSFSGWDNIPVSYEYNWDNSENCWQWGVWVDGTEYKTDPGTYDTNVRHGMQLYADDQNVYLNITFGREFSGGQIANGNDYQFWVDGQMAAYQVEWPDGSSMSYSQAAPGLYAMDVHHRDEAISYGLADGAVAYYRVNENNLNNQLEIKIPLEEFQRQNGQINLDNYSMIQFYTPNLMYNRISAAGSPTGSVPYAAAAFAFVPLSYIWLKRKNRKEVLA